MVKSNDILVQIRKAKEGNEQAYTFLLNTYWNDVMRFQLSKIQNESEAEDITVKTFARVFDKIHLYDEQYTFKTWILTISKNLYIDEFRKSKSEHITTQSFSTTDYDFFDKEPSPEDRIIIDQNLSQLLAFIKLLKPHYQEVINLRYFQEKSYKEIAEILDEPMSNVKIKILRAKKLLAEIIEKKK
ncbi:MAG: RNA polymerase sigma factor [Flavobacteriaceae bacterium]|nr:RNA polymerase sigma factor [Flavobacteriaceae bacterium]